MSSTLLRAIIAAVFAFHGIGHAMGVIPALGFVSGEASSQSWLRNWSSRSWLLTDLLGDSVGRTICVVLYSAALVGFLVAALALLGWIVPHEWWRTLAVVSAVISLVAILLYWNALILLFPHKIGALAVNIAVLICLLALNWPAEADLGF